MPYRGCLAISNDYGAVLGCRSGRFLKDFVSGLVAQAFHVWVTVAPTDFGKRIKQTLGRYEKKTWAGGSVHSFLIFISRAGD